MFSRFTEEAKKVLIDAKKEMCSLKHTYIGSEHLLLAILKNKNSPLAKKLYEYNLDYNSFKQEIINVVGMGTTKTEWYLYTPLLKKVLEDAILDAKEQNLEVTPEMLFKSLIEEGEGIAIRIMISMGMDIDFIRTQFNNKNIKKSKTKKRLLIDDYGYDLNKKASNEEIDPVIGREKEIERITEILCRRTKNNPLLIGEAGVGKTAIIEELSRKINLGEVPDKIKDKRIVSLSMSSLVAGTKYRGEFEERINKVMRELENDNKTIVFIDEIHTLVGAGGAEGAIDASNILKPVLARGKLQIIGATTIEEYKKHIEEERALDRRFQTVSIKEPDLDKTKEILTRLKPIYEDFHNVSISNEVIEDIIKYSNKYIYNRQQPDKAIDILDEVSAKASISKIKNKDKLLYLKEKLEDLIKQKNKAILNQDFILASNIRKEECDIESKINKLENNKTIRSKRKEVTRKMVADVIKLKTNIPVYELDNEKTFKIEALKKQLQDKIVGQDAAINLLCQVSQKIKLGYKKENKPVSMMFVGPTGVGKTLMVKEFSKLFIGDNSLITLDMSEYKEEHTISKIIGSPPGYIGYSSKKTVVEEIKNKPFSIILVDEIEKAHPAVVNLFLQILDEGRIRDSSGNIIRMDNTIIIMTSNIGFSKKKIGFIEDQGQIISKLNEFLSPEIINRIDEVVIFNKLKKEDVKAIVIKKLSKLVGEFKLKNTDIHINKKVIDEIVSKCNYEEFGGRKIDSVINHQLENQIITELLQNKRKINIETIH